MEVLGRYSNHSGALSKVTHRSEAPKAARPARPEYQRQRRLTPQESQELTARYGEGESARDLSAAFGIAVSTVKAHLRRAGIDRQKRGPVLRGQELERAAELYERGCSLREVAEQLGAGREAVRSGLRRAGVDVRRRGSPASSD